MAQGTDILEADSVKKAHLPSLEYRGQQYVFDSGVRLGSGGMAEVYVGQQRDDPNVHVAIKVPLPGLDPAVAELFLREAEAARRISNRHVVSVVDWGDQPPFIAFEFIEGVTLSQEIYARKADGRSWPEGKLIGLYHELAVGMSAVSQEVIHRDLKSDNIFLDNGVVKVSDFGIAKYVGEVTRSKTFKGWGTAAYMAPETFRSESINWLADQYSLGVVFFEMATLERPFSGDFGELEQQHLYERPPRVSTVATGLSERLASLIARMLEKQPEQRFQSWDDILGELEELSKGVPKEPDDGAEDPLVKKAARQVEEARTRDLERKRRADEKRDEVARRRNLLDYWVRELFDATRSRVDRLNASLGEETVKFEAAEGPFSEDNIPGKLCGVSFLHSGLTIRLEALPYNGPQGVALWGTFQARTSKRAAVGNFLLIDEPPPYGTWHEVGMKVSGLVSGRSPVIEGEDEGCRYEVVGGDRLVVARNWKGLIYQRDLRNAMSVVGYREEPLDFEALLNQLMDLVVEDAAAEPPRG